MNKVKRCAPAPVFAVWVRTHMNTLRDITTIRNTQIDQKAYEKPTDIG